MKTILVPSGSLAQFEAALDEVGGDAEDVWSVMADYLVPLKVPLFLKSISFISVLLHATATMVLDEASGDAVADWQHPEDDDMHITLTMRGVIADYERPVKLMYALLGYCVAHDIPFIGFESLGNVIPEYAFQAKAQEKADRIAAIYKRSDAEPYNTQVQIDCLKELLELQAPPPPPDSTLAQYISERMEPESKGATRQ